MYSTKTLFPDSFFIVSFLDIHMLTTLELLLSQNQWLTQALYAHMNNKKRDKKRQKNPKNKTNG
jgi:hypothetical protein